MKSVFSSLRGGNTSPQRRLIQIPSPDRNEVQGDAKSCNELFYEFSGHSRGFMIRDRITLCPPGKVITNHHHKFVSTVCDWKRPHYINSDPFHCCSNLVMNHLCPLGSRWGLASLALLAVLHPSACRRAH